MLLARVTWFMQLPPPAPEPLKYNHEGQFDWDAGLFECSQNRSNQPVARVVLRKIPGQYEQ